MNPTYQLYNAHEFYGMVCRGLSPERVYFGKLAEGTPTQSMTLEEWMDRYRLENQQYTPQTVYLRHEW